ncbi:MAG: SDR family NAD(P)-dependent oxidoreductase [Anaerolineaceae bacterium]|nr:SDR family NAD(P)-dependent oxidoreductase [Anaerolineaceae bacterium]
MKGKVTLVTGESSGIGKAAVLSFTNKGTKVVIASRNHETGKSVVHEILSSGGEAIWIGTDGSLAEQVESILQTTIDTYGRHDYAFINASTDGKGNWGADIEKQNGTKPSMTV